MDSEELAEIKKLIEENGGVVSENSRFIFTNHKTYIGNEDVFDINYIRECVRVGQLLELIDFKIGKKGLLGCLMTFFSTGNRYCSCGTTDYSNRCPMHTAGDIELTVVHDVDHNYVHRGSVDDDESKEKDNSIFSDISTMPSTQGTGDTQFSDSIFDPDNSSSTNCTQAPFEDDEQNVTNTNSAIETREANSRNLTTQNSYVQTYFSELRIDEEKDWDDINAIFPLSAAEEEAYDESSKNCNNLKSVTEHASNSPNEQSNKVQILSSTLLSASNIVKIRPKKMKKRRSKSKEIEEEVRVAAPSKIDDTVIILGDSSNRTKPITQSSRVARSSWASSSDSDTTDWDQFSPSARSCKNSPETIGKIRCNKFSEDLITSSENKCPNEEQPGPSRVRHISISSGNELSTSDSVISLDSKPKSPKRRKRRSCTPRTQQNLSKLSNDEKNTVVSSTRMIDQKSNSADNSQSDIEGTKTRSKTPRPDTVQDSQNNRIKSEINKKRVFLSRNFAPWEQKEMVQYLIRTNCISEAKGNQIWKQMIDDGYLEHRTFQSLNNHFRRTVLPNIDRFNMDSKSRAKFEKLRN